MQLFLTLNSAYPSGWSSLQKHSIHKSRNQSWEKDALKTGVEIIGSSDQYCFILFFTVCSISTVVRHDYVMSFLQLWSLLHTKVCSMCFSVTAVWMKLLSTVVLEISIAFRCLFTFTWVLQVELSKVKCASFFHSTQNQHPSPVFCVLELAIHFQQNEISPLIVSPL
jgi:hypothetical protein